MIKRLNELLPGEKFYLDKETYVVEKVNESKQTIKVRCITLRGCNGIWDRDNQEVMVVQ
jgi:hypothetical protein